MRRPVDVKAHLPGDEESAGVNYSHRSLKGNRHMRRLLNQAANAAVKVKGSIFEVIYRRCVPRLGHNQAIGVIAHRSHPEPVVTVREKFLWNGVGIYMLRKRRGNNHKQLLHLLRRWGAISQPSMVGALNFRPVLAVLKRRAFAEVIEDRRVIKNAAVSVLDPLPAVGYLPRLLDAWHFPNDGNQGTGVYVS